MITYRAIGKYALGASRDDKVRALRRAIVEACVELAELGVDGEALEATLEEGHFAAEDVWAEPGTATSAEAAP